MSDNCDKLAVLLSSSGGFSSSDDEDTENSPEYDQNADLIRAGVKAKLAAAGPAGVAAAAAISSGKTRRRLHSFETHPSVRKRQQNRLLRKLRQTITEFTTRVGQQAIVLVASPGKPKTNYKVFGAKPLEDVMKNLGSMVMEELENALAHEAPPPTQEDPALFELPPLIIDGIPTAVEKMTQAQLRTHIPLMLKYSLGRGKPGWGRESTRPLWWPESVPWANVRLDTRTEDEKVAVPWTQTLRQIVINCYKYHGREDLLPVFNDDKHNIIDLTKVTQNSDETYSVVTFDSSNFENDEVERHEVEEIITESYQHGEIIDWSCVTEVTFSPDGQVFIKGEGDSVYPVMVANIQHLQINSDGIVCMTPLSDVPKLEPNNLET